MCTAIKKDYLFGRNLDLDYDIPFNVIYVPRNHPFSFLHLPSSNHHYAMMGMGMLVNNYPLYFDAFNEVGLAAAGLNFPNNAVFNAFQNHKNNLSPYELIPYVLSHFKNIQEVKEFLLSANLINVPFAKEIPLAPLHYLFADQSGSLVLEQDDSGLHVYDNPYNVLTNNPQFPQHLENAKRYLDLSNAFINKRLIDLKITPDSVGYGSLGLPGDYTSTSRFIKALYLNKYVILPSKVDAAINIFINMLTSLSFLPGVALSRNHLNERTIYSGAMDLKHLSYYYRDEHNSELIKIDMPLTLNEIKTFKVI